MCLPYHLTVQSHLCLLVLAQMDWNTKIAQTPPTLYQWRYSHALTLINSVTPHLPIRNISLWCFPLCSIVISREVGLQESCIDPPASQWPVTQHNVMGIHLYTEVGRCDGHLLFHKAHEVVGRNTGWGSTTVLAIRDRTSQRGELRGDGG